MRSVTTLNVQPDMLITVKLDMTVREMEALLEILQKESAWPSTPLYFVLKKGLTAAREQFTAEFPT